MKKTLLATILGMLCVTQAALADEIRITADDINQGGPIIDGNTIVWLEDRHSNLDIYLYNLSTEERKRITDGFEIKEEISFSGNRVVWADNRHGNWDVYLYDLATNEKKNITSHKDSQTEPAISGDKIVWTDNRHGNNDIYLYNLATGEKKQITNDSRNQEYPAISGDKIVWQDDRNGSSDIYLYDLATGKEKRITENDRYQCHPDISGDKIVWQDARSGNGGIYLYDLATGKEKRITKDNGKSQGNPAVSGDKIVWMDDRHGNWDVYLYDLATGKEKRITKNDKDQWYPDISGDKIVWMDDRHGNWDVYLYNPEQPSTTPIHRFYSQKYRTHFYTMSEDEKNHIITTYPAHEWNYEGIAYKSFNRKTDATQPIHRFWSQTHKKHFYTMSEDEKNMIINGAYPESRWTYEGIAWYAAPTHTSTTTPIFRFHSQQYNAHFFTMSEDEKNHIITTYPKREWNYEGVAWFGEKN